MTSTHHATSRRGVIFGALSALVLAAAVAIVRQRSTPELIVQSDESFPGEIRVAIAGEVMAPGTYTLHGDARLADLIAAAGGYTDGAARDVLNPAARVSDGQSYTIPIRATPGPRAATATAHAPTTVSTVAPTIEPPAASTGDAAVAIPAPATSDAPDATAAAAPASGEDAPGDPPPTAVEALEDVVTYIEPEVVALHRDPQGTNTPHNTRTPRAPRLPRPAAAPRATATPHAPVPTRTAATPRATASTHTRTPARTATTRHAVLARAATRETVNINTASREELAALPPLGAALADRIVADRAAHGPYARMDDLTRVPGITQQVVDELRSRVTVG